MPDLFGPKLANTPYSNPGRLSLHVIDNAAKDFPDLSRRALTSRIHAINKRNWEEQAVTLTTAFVPVPKKRARV
jgi:hypothetical protein